MRQVNPCSVFEFDQTHNNAIDRRGAYRLSSEARCIFLCLRIEESRTTPVLNFARTDKLQAAGAEVEIGIYDFSLKNTEVHFNELP